MATTGKGSTTVDQKLKEHEEEIRALRRQKHFECNHDNGSVMYLSQYNGVIKNADKYSKTTMIHPDCGAIFEGAAYDKDEVNKTFFDLESMCHQIKMLAGKGLSEKNREDLYKCMEYIEYLQHNLGNYYNSMVETLNSDQTKKQRDNRKIGGIGVNAGMFA